MSGSTTYTLSVNASGAQPQTPAALQALLLQTVAAIAPGYTANLPGSLIEDISSTDVGAMLAIDAAAVDTVNSISPFTANPFILNQLGQVYGVQQGSETNTSVYVVFSCASGGSATPGFFIPSGFTVSDGTYQYTVQEGGTTSTGGTTAPLYCLATTQGSWAVAAGSVTQITTSLPSGYTITCTNPQPGTPGAAAQTTEDYRSQVLQAGLASALGMPRMLRTALQAVPGVQARLITIQQVTGGGWKVIVGGGDPYQVAGAIFQSLFDISTLNRSSTASRNVSVSIIDFPDDYLITFVNPPAQTVTVGLTWNTNGGNYVNPAAVQQLGAAAIANYVNSIQVGQAINLFDMEAVFQQAVVSLIPTNLLTRMVFAVAINGTTVSPTTGTGLIAGDPESYFTTTSSAISITQG